jgi:Flp pilus assembly secretin CpaC
MSQQARIPVLVIGGYLGAGKTTLVIWEENAAPLRFDVQVVLDLTPTEDFSRLIQADLKRELPEDAIQFNGNAETIVLTGAVKNADSAKRAARCLNFMLVTPSLN